MSDNTNQNDSVDVASLLGGSSIEDIINEMSQRGSTTKIIGRQSPSVGEEYQGVMVVADEAELDTEQLIELGTSMARRANGARNFTDEVRVIDGEIATLTEKLEAHSFDQRTGAKRYDLTERERTNLQKLIASKINARNVAQSAAIAEERIAKPEREAAMAKANAREDIRRNFARGDARLDAMFSEELDRARAREAVAAYLAAK